jgi:hypothetical protein
VLCIEWLLAGSGYGILKFYDPEWKILVMPGRRFISSREWVAITALGFLLGMVTMAVASSLSSDKAALIVLAPGFFLQELAGAGGHDENGYFLLVLGQFLFCSGIVLAIFVAIKLWLRRQQS